ncbi:alpha/beta-hydrolase [Eremomyces bilateralis CBS 781.70]|uniref:Alpha/beta-hydrolase n=1 Tax=Eremomyces bilateralis CBS 781.70 TaxID=1392243 RepID=A0A6G1GEC8_9PEZI|nr:alpha/beta-hydrolase [Eremomyces bilateralis CBS 781.70]KAF1816465.1 alpha/beta-hydrolase [Eremomyces bilateralis CBS 781.70]
MARVPFIGRLYPIEYLSLLISILLVALEGFIRIITLALPKPIISLGYQLSRRLFNSLSSQQSLRSRNRKKAVVNSIAQAADFVELCEYFGYYAEEHVVQTGDGYLLGLHRLGWKRGEEDVAVNSGPGSVRKKVVYLHHGLLMNSEVWICLTDRERCLPFLLVEQGYDVWLGNNRGNKYSKKNIRLPPTDPRFWSFSIDQFAFFDIPDSINYILQTTGHEKLAYIGFSQGTAQAFATLSIHPDLNGKVSVFIALAPAMSPPGLTAGIVDSFVKASPDVLFLLFGRRAILGSTTMWQALLYPPIFVRAIDISLKFLFGWTGKNISTHQKLAAYPHLYSFTSTKSVVHWFQIIRNGKFQMYDDEIQSPFTLSNSTQYYKVAKFPTRNIKTPIVLLYGGTDSLVDISVMMKELPKHTTATRVPHYEHLDFLWGSDVQDVVFPHVFAALDRFTNPSTAATFRALSGPKSYAGVLKSPLSTSTDEDSIGESSSSNDPTKVSESIEHAGNGPLNSPFQSPFHGRDESMDALPVPLSSENTENRKVTIQPRREEE